MMTAMILEIRRTNDYMAPWMTQMISPRLPEKLLQKIEESAPHTPVYHKMRKLKNVRQDINNQVRGIHTNWRVAVYYPGKIIKTYVKRKQEWIKENDPGNAFPAHYDLSDTVRVDAEEEGAIEVIEG